MNKCDSCKFRVWTITYTKAGEPVELSETGCQYRVAYFGYTPDVEITECNQYQAE